MSLRKTFAVLPHGDQGATRSLGMLSGLPPLPQSSGRPTAAQLPVLGETSSGVPCPVGTGRGGERAARERGVLPTGVYPALGTHTTSKSARRHIVKIALFERYVWGTGRVSEKMLLVGPRALSISSTTTPRAAALGHSAADARHCSCSTGHDVRHIDYSSVKW